MLVLSRKLGERILIDDHIVITILAAKNGIVRLGIEAPQEVRILREELQKKEIGLCLQLSLLSD